jgi:oxygen-independent coproporphyrinogen III oxidase
MNITKYPGIYVHIPFCQVKCGYCDFYSETTYELKEKFLEALIKEIHAYKELIAGTASFDTIYIGGGTPSVLETHELENILNNIKNTYDFNYDSEITIEINPGTIGYSELEQYFRSGFSRLSIGIQSFNDHELKLLGRIHNSDQAKCCILDAREAGFNSINIDLIYALPDQTIDEWIYSMETGIQFSPEHISAYNLIYEENTPFYQKLISNEYLKQDNEQEALFFSETNEFLTRAGYQQYEISNYANSALNVSRHNYKYWHHIPYISFGPSAHSFWNNKRWSNVRSIKKYIAMIEEGKMPVEFEEAIDKSKMMNEFLMLRLRTANGINLEDYYNTFNKNFTNEHASVIDQLISKKYAKLEDGHFKLTFKGLIICDEISPMFTT